MPSVLADMHVPPALRQWGTRLGLAIVVAIGIGYLPAQALRRDPRTVKLAAQLGALDVETRTLTEHNAARIRDLEALRIDVGAIEARARGDLGMVYPDEIVLRIVPAPGDDGQGAR